ncbi:MAG: hypothetical protein AB1744_01645 [Candidatus Zixiibacteriota bacterium]
MLTIKQWASEPEDLEILWLAGLYRTAKLGWQVRVWTKGRSTGAVVQKDLPIGLLPILAPGKVVSGGRIATLPATGVPMSASIPNLAEGEELDAYDCIKPQLYWFGGHRGWKQRVLKFKVGRQTLLIPTMELVRFLFLHNKALARAIMQPAGLLNLALPVEPGFHKDLQIDFTWGIPRRALSRNEVKEFAWLAVDPAGRRAWDSVRDRSRNQRFVSFEPPPLKTRLEFRGVEWSSHRLVLEIKSMSGRTLPCETLRYSHPAERAVRVDGRLPGTRQVVVRRSRQDGPGRSQGDEVDPTAQSRRDKRQRALPVIEKISAFENDVPVQKVKEPKVIIGKPIPIPGPDAADAGRSPRVRQPLVRRPREVVSVGPEGLKGGLPPIEFQLLKTAGWECAGETDWLASVIKRIAAENPDLSVSMSLCYLGGERSISRTSRDQRACLVAMFRSADLPPVVLLDVDHAGITALAGMMLRYLIERPQIEIEEHIQKLLDTLVARSGKWDKGTEASLPDYVRTRRLPRVLRRQGKRSTAEMINQWTDRLVARVRGRDTSPEK